MSFNQERGEPCSGERGIFLLAALFRFLLGSKLLCWTLDCDPSPNLSIMWESSNHGVLHFVCFHFVDTGDQFSAA